MQTGCVAEDLTRLLHGTLIQPYESRQRNDYIDHPPETYISTQKTFSNNFLAYVTTCVYYLFYTWICMKLTIFSKTPKCCLMNHQMVLNDPNDEKMEEVEP